MHLKRSAIAIIILLATCTSKRQPTYTWLYGNEALEKINGNVKQISTEWHSANTAIIECSDFDQQGNVINGKESFSTSIIKFNEQRERYQETAGQLDLQSRQYKFKNKFDSVGRKTESIKTKLNWGDINVFSTYKFDKYGHLTMEIPNSRGSFNNEVELYKYNDVGNLIEEDHMFGKHLFFSFKYKYDKNGSWIERLYYSGKGHLDAVDKREYLSFDDKKNWTKMIEGVDTVLRKITYY